MTVNMSEFERVRDLAKLERKLEYMDRIVVAVLPELLDEYGIPDNVAAEAYRVAEALWARRERVK